MNAAPIVIRFEGIPERLQNSEYMIWYYFEYQEFSIVTSDPCVFDMAFRHRRRDFRAQSRNWPFYRSTALKYKDMAPLLYALTRAYTRLHSLVWAYFAPFSLVRACLPSLFAWLR